MQQQWITEEKNKKIEMAQLEKGNIYPQHERLLFLNKIKEKGFSVSDFNIEVKESHPVDYLLFSWKDYKVGSTQKFFSWTKETIKRFKVDYTPAENYFRKTKTIDNPNTENINVKDDWTDEQHYTYCLNKTLEYFDHFLIKLRELLNLENEYSSMFSEEYNNFVNADYWESDDPLEDDKSQKLIEGFERAKIKIDAFSDEDVPPTVKNYYKYLIDRTIEQIKKKVPRKVIKEHVMAFGYAVIWDVLIHEDKRLMVWNIVTGLAKSTMIVIANAPHL